MIQCINTVEDSKYCQRPPMLRKSRKLAGLGYRVAAGVQSQAAVDGQRWHCGSDGAARSQGQH